MRWCAVVLLPWWWRWWWWLWSAELGGSSRRPGVPTRLLPANVQQLQGQPQRGGIRRCGGSTRQATPFTLKGQSNEIFYRHFFSYFEPVWVTDLWVKIYSISLSYSNFRLEKLTPRGMNQHLLLCHCVNILRIGRWLPGVMIDTPGSHTPGSHTPGSHTPGSNTQGRFLRTIWLTRRNLNQNRK